MAENDTRAMEEERHGDLIERLIRMRDQLPLQQRDRQDIADAVNALIKECEHRESAERERDEATKRAEAAEVLATDTASDWNTDRKRVEQLEGALREAMDGIDGLFRWRASEDSPWRVTDWEGVPDPELTYDLWRLNAIDAALTQHPEGSGP
jgi:hypothetical protein